VNANISVFIITYNEERTITDCIRSVSWSNDIVVLDSNSTDTTKKTVLSFPQTRFVQRAFDDFSSQRNYGLHKITFKNPWVFIIDADERCPEELAQEMAHAANDKTKGKKSPAYLIRKKEFFQGRMMKHNTCYPVWYERLVKPKEVRFEREVHEHLVFKGKPGRLKGHIHHYPFTKGLSQWISKHNNYSDREALLEYSSTPRFRIRELMSKNAPKRRNAMKAFSRKLPCRWVFYFFYNLFFRLAFLDGIPGIHFLFLKTWYEFIISQKVAELRG